ncbi:PREDICTED: uncharacterized protein LOC105151180 isoform X2 [Acromyrmex echinatior]|uniref:uncharacterized protein LOC105151180 isoform X2 n=1 Tax=Acromyrmex echinatior TaxID=103372 RepID=UPI000580C241|nr:PREDICTED: uncharacterized protein LOC105151180 isoform X2 [Acromyrmex echinatior]
MPLKSDTSISMIVSLKDGDPCPDEVNGRPHNILGTYISRPTYSDINGTYFGYHRTSDYCLVFSVEILRPRLNGAR